MSDDSEQEGFLPLSSAEYERRKTATLDEGGMVFDIYDDRMEISLSPEMKALLAKDAAALGMDVESYMRRLWQEHVNLALEGKS